MSETYVWKNTETVASGDAADVLLSGLCEDCGTCHDVKLVGAPQRDTAVKVRPVCWVCGRRSMAVIYSVMHSAAGTT